MFGTLTATASGCQSHRHLAPTLSSMLPQCVTAFGKFLKGLVDGVGGNSPLFFLRFFPLFVYLSSVFLRFLSFLSPIPLQRSR